MTSHIVATFLLPRDDTDSDAVRNNVMFSIVMCLSVVVFHSGRCDEQ
jgi:hypothetical protein